MRSWPNKIISLLMILVFFQHTRGAGPGSQSLVRNFDRLSLEQGLSQSNVLSILQDKQGFMWIGTGDGLNRYDGYKFTVYRNKPGNLNSLSDNVIQSIYADEKGVLWVGTANGGFCSLDPNTGKVMRYIHEPGNPNSLGHNNVRDIEQDKQGHFWIGTYGGGVDEFDPELNQFTHYTHDPQNESSLSDDRVHSLQVDHEGEIWVGTVNGLNRLIQPETGQWIQYYHDPSDSNSISRSCVFSVMESSDGTIWVGTSAGFTQLPKKGQATFVRYHDTNSSDLSSSVVQTLYEDHAGTLWLGTFYGIVQFDKTTGRTIEYQFDPEDFRSISRNSISNNITALYEDTSGLLWIGTKGGGLYLYKPRSNKILHYTYDPNHPNSLSYPSVRGIYEDKNGILWVGGYAGLNRIDRETGRFTHYSVNDSNGHELSTDLIYTIIGDPQYEDILWIGSEGNGLYRFNKKTGQAIHYLETTRVPKIPGVEYILSNNKVFDLYLDSARVLWIATDKGLDRMVLNEKNDSEPTVTEITHYTHDTGDDKSISQNNVRVIFADREGYIWIGTESNGLNRYARETGQFTRFRHDPYRNHSLSNNRIKAIYEDRKGRLWIGTSGGGLNRFNRTTETFSYYSEEDGLANNVVYGILEDNHGNLWLSTNMGLSRFSPATGEFRNYAVEDGLQSNEFNTGSHFKSQGGELFFGGINGLNAFFPDSISDDPYIPPVVITDFRIFNESVPVGEMPDGRTLLQSHISELNDVGLSYKDDVISFEFAALSYAVPDKNKYAYKLEGFDEDWVYTDAAHRIATYTRLEPGDYVFRVIGANHDGTWNKDGASVHLSIAPPPWQTWWAYTLYVLLFLSTTASLYFRQVNKLKKEKIQQQKTIAHLQEVDVLRTATLESREKYQNLFEQSRHAIFFCTQEGEFLDVNQSFLDLFGYTRDEITRLDAGTLFVDSEARTGLFRELEQEGSIADFELQLFNRNKQEMVCLFSATLMRDKKGTITGYQVIINDITARKRTEATLAEKTIYLDNILRSATEYAIVTTDLNFHITYCNPMAEKLHGYTVKDVLGEKVREILIGEKTTPERFEQTIQKILLHGEYLSTVEKETNDGIRFIDLRVSGIFDTHGVLVGFASFARDITEQKGAQEKFARQLIESQEEERKRIAGELHDSLGQDLLVIKNLALIGLEPTSNMDDAQTNLKKISDNASEAIEEVRKISRNLRPYHLDQLGLSKALESTLDNFSRLFPVRFVYTLDNIDNIFAPGLEIHIFRIIQESLNNIVKHAEANKAVVSAEKTKSHIVFTIKDDGKGMNLAHHKSALPQALGFGLSGMSQRARILGGELDLQSTPGQGTTITLKIPSPEVKHEG